MLPIVALAAGATLALTTLLMAFPLAMTLGLISMVPGALGVFEGAMLLILGRPGCPGRRAAAVPHRLYLRPLPVRRPTPAGNPAAARRWPYRRIGAGMRGAYHRTQAPLLSGAILSLLKGIDIEVAALLLILLP